MVEFRIGLSKKYGASKLLKEYFEHRPKFEGIFYVGYPILFSTIESKVVDALWVSEQYGAVVFDIIEGPILNESRTDVQDDLFIRLETLLQQYPELRKGRKLSVNIHPLTYAPTVPKQSTDFDCVFNAEDLDLYLSHQKKWDNPGLFVKTLSVLQSVTKLKGESERDNIKKEDSKGAKIRALENTIATLDGDQEKAILEYFEGVQRIRGLAGSGKTIVLALKAAYIHSIHPDWKIAVTFNTRALKNQFKELIERFVAEKKGTRPNWNNIKIIQAWGSSKSEGIYFNICKDYGIEYYDFKRAEFHRNSLGQSTRPAFEVICEKALNEIPKTNYKQSYDLILVDEAQDLSQYFLQLCYNILTDKKRLVYAYDELQKLYEGSPLNNPNEIFGISDFSDEILETCYRNSRPVLTTAHALGFGIYRDKPDDEKLVQFFDNPKLWNDVGYQVIDGEMKANNIVQLSRTAKSSPKYLEEYLGEDTDKIISFHVCASKEEQAIAVAKEIFHNLKNDELLYRDIVVINPEAITTKDEIALIRSLLHKKGINTHIAGEFDSDVFFQNDSITFTGINRAKGNEVPMVYIINGQYCFEGKELRKKRNILFTAITRSKAWVKIFGIGVGMSNLRLEFDRVKANDFTLKFKYPTKEQIEKMNLINRDLSRGDKQIIRNDIEAITEMIERIKAGKNQIEDYPEEIQKMIKTLLK
jgi:superfamily I DNA and RNA helicase